jgi:hypothetical protein
MVLRHDGFGGAFEFNGDQLTFHLTAESEEHMLSRLQFLQFALPGALSAVLPDPTFIARVEGTLASAEFRVEHTRSTTPLVILDDQSLSEQLAAGLSRLDLLAEVRGQRLMAAIHYMHVASRLLASGYSPWEFMAEALLNYSKALEVLFGDSRSEQRAGLRAIGISQLDAETRFIPVTLLRDVLDVAHPKLAQLDKDRLQSLYVFLVGLEGDFQRLITRTYDSISSGLWSPAPVSSQEFDTRDLNTLDRILLADAQRREGKIDPTDA